MSTEDLVKVAKRHERYAREEIVKAAKRAMQEVTETAKTIREMSRDAYDKCRGDEAEELNECAHAHETGGLAVLDAVLRATGYTPDEAKDADALAKYYGG